METKKRRNVLFEGAKHVIMRFNVHLGSNENHGHGLAMNWPNIYSSVAASWFHFNEPCKSPVDRARSFQELICSLSLRWLKETFSLETKSKSKWIFEWLANRGYWHWVHTLQRRQRRYHVHRITSHSITHVERHWARLVLGWVFTWEHRVSLASLVFQ